MELILELLVHFLILFTGSISGLKCSAGKRRINNICVCTPLSPKTRNHTDCQNVEEVDKQYMRALEREGCSKRGYLISEKKTCSCDKGWEGPFCEIPLCQNDGVPHSNKNHCKCGPAFKGLLCENHNCYRGKWNETLGECVCRKNWDGSLCKDPVCLNGGNIGLRYKNSLGYCSCPYFFTGRHCQWNKCQYGNLTNNKCECDRLYSGRYCDIPYCFNGRRHHHRYIKACQCDTRWHGEHCHLCNYTVISGECCPDGFYGTMCFYSRREPEKETGGWNWDWVWEGGETEWDVPAALATGGLALICFTTCGICKCVNWVKSLRRPPHNSEPQPLPHTSPDNQLQLTDNNPESIPLRTRIVSEPDEELPPSYEEVAGGKELIIKSSSKTEEPPKS